jgi:hypothetical protein
MASSEEGILGVAAIRRSLGITLEQIADATKIGVRCLRAIEQGDFRALPGGIYNVSYIRQYARAIGYNEQALLAFYRRSIAPRPAALPRPAPPPPNPGFWAWMLLGLRVMTAGWWARRFRLARRA